MVEWHALVAKSENNYLHADRIMEYQNNVVILGFLVVVGLAAHLHSTA